MNVEIITIGDEILIGQIVDTNSAWMSKELTENGFSVRKITSVQDNADEIKKAVDAALKSCEVVLLTGGLGPTKDDITKRTLGEYFNTPIVFRQSVYDHLVDYLKVAGYQMNTLNRTQAEVPELAEIINNETGTAPIMLFPCLGGKTLVSMPGVPHEMRFAMTKVIPILRERHRMNELLRKHFLVYGIPESVLAERLSDWENSLPSSFKLAYLPNAGVIRLRLTAPKAEENQLSEYVQKLRPLLGQALLSEEDKPVEQLVGELLKAKGLTLATAESCTGGNIAHKITLIPGSSAYFKGGVIAYDNAVKEDQLNVSPFDIDEYGVVSIPIVEQMARGALDLLDVDVAVATSGIAGPTGATEEKQVGTVCIAVATKDSVMAQQFVFGNMRERNIERATTAALVMLMKAIS